MSTTELLLCVQSTTGVTRMYRCLRDSMLLCFSPSDAGDIKTSGLDNVPDSDVVKDT